MFSEILVPVDISQPEASHRALDVAKTNVDEQTRIVLFHVVDPVPALSGISEVRSQIADTVTLAKEVLHDLIREEGLPNDTEVRIARGNVHRMIVKCITDPDSQAIVMASHNPKLSDIVLGSVAAQVVKHATCSVMVVRHH